MSLMNLLSRTLKSKKRSIVAISICTMSLTLFYYLLLDSAELIYPISLGLGVLIVYLAIEGYKLSCFFEILDDIKKAECDLGKIDLDYFDGYVLSEINKIHNNYTSRISELENQIKDRDELFSTWIHNMKTSVAIIDLASESEIDKDSILLDIKEENLLLKKNLEECLNIIRLDNFSRDYMTDSYNLSNVVRGVINDKRRDFIYSGVFPKVDIDEEIEVYTDKKWLSYILEQVISNAIKYSDKGRSVEFYMINDECNVVLFIKDHGIGISKTDINRVFEPFFTGETGRENRDSTGIGLYMVKTIADKLGHRVYIDSEISKGTSFKIIFNLSKM